MLNLVPAIQAILGHMSGVMYVEARVLLILNELVNINDIRM